MHSSSDDNPKTLEAYVDHLKNIFNLADKDGSGSLHQTEFIEVLRSIDIDISTFELEILLSEIDANGNGLIDFEEFIPVCAELLQVLYSFI